MADTIVVHNERELIDELVEHDDFNFDSSDVRELWRIWTERYENGADDEYLIGIPGWFARKEFDAGDHPLFFAEIEHDGSDNAILFTNLRRLDANVIVNSIWDDVTMSESLTVVDISDDDDYIDERGKAWIPRSLATVFERTNQQSLDGGLTGMGADGVDQ
jgi:hypothetical protein